MSSRKRSVAFIAASNKWSKKQSKPSSPTARESDLPIIVIDSDDEAPISSGTLPVLLLRNSTTTAGASDTVTMESLMGSPDITETFQFNFNVDLKLALSYLHRNVQKLKRKVTFVVGSPILDDAANVSLKADFNIYELVAPLPNKFASHHTKMMINFYPQAVEIVIMSCNFTKLDIAGLGQMVWRSGRLPLIGDSKPSTFKQELMLYLKRYNLATLNVLAYTLDKYDFLTVNVELISSAPGDYDMKNPAKSNGLCGYGRLWEALLEHGLLYDEKSNTKSNFLAQATSIAYPFTSAKGKVSSIFSHILCPLVFSKNLENFKILEPGSTLCRSHQERYKYSPHLVFPTVREISQSIVGFGSGQAIHFNYSKTAVHVAQYLQTVRPYLRRYTNERSASKGRKTVMPHLKVLLCDNADDWKSIKWMYFGSHNLSKQAWGMPKRYKALDPLLYNVDSYELGILIFPPTGLRYVPATDTSLCTSNGDIKVSLPFPVPAMKYSPKDVPWSMHQSYPGIFDVFGREYILDQQ